MDQLELATRTLLDAGYEVIGEMNWIEVFPGRHTQNYDTLRVAISDDTDNPEKPVRVCGYIFFEGENPLGEIDIDPSDEFELLDAVARAMNQQFNEGERII